MLTYLATLTLLAGAGSPALQAPSVQRPEPAPAERAAPTAPATAEEAAPPVLPEGPAVPAETPAATPAPAEPSPATSPSPAPAHWEEGSVSAAPAVSPSAPAPVVEAPQPVFSAAGSDAWKSDYVRVRQPRYRGNGFFVAGGFAIGTVGLKQLVTLSLCGTTGCGGPRLTDQVLMGASVSAFAAGGWRRGRYFAYRDAIFEEQPRKVRNLAIAGGVMAGVGVAAVATDFALMTKCWVGNEGPYVTETEWGSECESTAGTLALDFGGMVASAGAGMLGYALAYRRDSRVYSRGRVVVSPIASRSRVGVSVQGSF